MADEVRLIDANSVCRSIVDSIRYTEQWISEAREQQDTIGLQYASNTYSSLISMLERIQNEPTIEAEPVNGWISVENRLPDDKERYLICTEDGRIDIAYYQPIGDKFSDYEPFWQGSCRFTTSVTHWQHLPEPPKGE